MTTRRKSPERDIQRAILEMIRRKFCNCYVIHYPGVGGPTAADRRRSAIMVGDGAAAGFPDLIVGWVPDKEHVPGFQQGFVEVKSGSGSLSAPQREWRDRLKEMGARWVMVRSVDEAHRVLDDWGLPRR